MIRQDRDTGSEAFLFSLRAEDMREVMQNLGVVEIELTPDDLREIEDVASKITIQGARLPEAVLKLSER
jgi:hypothetical protein